MFREQPRKIFPGQVDLDHIVARSGTGPNREKHFSSHGIHPCGDETLAYPIEATEFEDRRPEA
jgi:hypothetical protein